MKKQPLVFLALLIFLTIGALHSVTAGWETTAATTGLRNSQEESPYSLTVTTAGAGSLTQEPQGDELDFGTVITLRAAAQTGWPFADWSGDLITTTNPVTFTMDTDKAITATFTLNNYSITVSASPPEGGTVVGGGLYDHEQTVIVTATANPGYTFLNRTEDDTEVSTDSVYSFTAEADRSLVANFDLNSYTITLAAAPELGGSLSGAGIYDHGATVVITATANPGYTFLNWTEDGTEVSADPVYSFTAEADRSLVANFNIVYGLELTPDNLGNGNPGEVITYTHLLTNLAIVSDAFDITINGGAGFEASLISATPMTLAAGETRTLTITVTIPADAAGQLTAETRVTAKSWADHNVTATATNTTTVNKVYELLLLPDNPRSGNPGEVLVYSHSLTNQSNITDSYALTATSSAGFGVVLSPATPITLTAGASISVTLTVAIPPGTLAGTVDTTSLTAVSQTDSSVTGTVTNTTTVNTVFGLLLEPDKSGSGDPGQTVVYTHTLTNQTNITDTFNIVASSSLGFGTGLAPLPPITVGAGASTTLTLSVTIPAGTLAGRTDTTSVTATSQTDTSVTGTAVNATTVNTVYGLLLTPDNQSAGNPGQTLLYSHTLTNQGNDVDTFDITTNSSAGFTVTLVSETSVTLVPGTSATVVLTVGIPDDAAAGIVDVTSVTATSQSMSSVSATVTNTTSVNPVYALLLAPNNSQSGVSGHTLVYTHTLTNLGNGTDTFAITTSSLVGFEVALISPTPVTLTAGASTTVELAVTIPPTTPGGTNDITSVNATSQGNTNVSGTAVNVTTAISPIYNPVLGPDNSGSGFPGQTVVYTHTVTNQGNTSDTFVITANSSAGFGLELAPDAPIPLAVGHNATITLAVTIPPGTLASVVDTTTVTATSQGNTSVTDTATSTTSVNSVAGVMLTPALSEKEGEPGETVSHSFMVHNSGNAADTFTMSGYSSEGFILAIEPISVTLPHGESAPIIVAVTVPLTAAFGTLDMTIITTTSTIDSAVTATAAAHTLVEENILDEYQISGQVRDQQGNPVAGVTIAAGSDYSALTDSNGNYILTGLPAGSYTLTPGKSGYSFTPASLSVTVPPDADDRDFTAVRLPSLLYLPMVQNNYISYFEGPWEVEPNNSSAQANGPLRSGRDYFGYPNDAYDFFSVYLTQPGQLNVTLTNHTGQGVQLQLFYQSTANRVGFVPSPPYTLSYNGQAGWYYIFIYTESGFNSTTPYTLRVTYP